jgi:hypothetical protein
MCALASSSKCPLAGGVGWWLRQFSDTGEGTVSGIAQTMQQLGGGTCWMQKVADGLTWQGQADPETPITSMDTLEAFAQATAAAGLPLVPVVVPRGADPAGEGTLHGQIAAALGSLCVDLEPYAGFWDGSDLSQIPVYLQALRAAASDAYLILQHDPREYGSSAIGMPGIASSFDGICGQHYIGWTEVGWTDLAAEVASFQSLAALGRDMYATVWALGDLSLLAQFWSAILPQCQGYSVFAFGYADAAELAAVAALPRPAQPMPPVPNPIGLITALQQIRDTANAALKGPSSAGSDSHETERPAHDADGGEQPAHVGPGVV